MIVGHGVDIVCINRFKIKTNDRLERLADRICTELEYKKFQESKIPYLYVAKIWAAKEAISKAFGTGIQRDVTWKTIQIENNKDGKPCVSFKSHLAGPTCHLSISHEKDYLLASAILELQ